LRLEAALPVWRRAQRLLGRHVSPQLARQLALAAEALA
jgi:hypothetical protein